MLDVFERTAGPLLPWDLAPGYEILGGLACSVEGSVKRRIFPICNYVSQRQLRPFHEWLSNVLRRIPQDASINVVLLTHSPVPPLYFPLTRSLQRTDGHCTSCLGLITQYLFDRSFASAAVHSALAYQSFDIGFLFRKTRSWPPGYNQFDCWATLGDVCLLESLHTITLCSDVVLCREGSPLVCAFSKYAILGDDVVIADEAVAREFERSLCELGVQISTQKSLISPYSKGAAEFAKKFVIRNLTKEISPVFLRVLLNSNHPTGAMSAHNQYFWLPFSTLCPLIGYSRKSLTRIQLRRSLKVERVLAIPFGKFTYGPLVR